MLNYTIHTKYPRKVCIALLNVIVIFSLTPYLEVIKWALRLIEWGALCVWSTNFCIRVRRSKVTWQWHSHFSDSSCLRFKCMAFHFKIRFNVYFIFDYLAAANWLTLSAKRPRACCSGCATFLVLYGATTVFPKWILRLFQLLFH